MRKRAAVFWLKEQLLALLDTQNYHTTCQCLAALGQAVRTVHGHSFSEVAEAVAPGIADDRPENRGRYDHLCKNCDSNNTADRMTPPFLRCYNQPRVESDFLIESCR